MSKTSIPKQIKSVLSEGPKLRTEIHKSVSGKSESINQAIRRLESGGNIIQIQPEKFSLPEVQDAPVEVENPRGEAENTETINKLLNLYDKLLYAVARSIEAEDWDGIVEKIETIKSLRWLGATADQLIKRWYLVHRGYDSNTRQAQEDAKKKTVDREKQALENTPPEERVVVVREYNESMRDLLENLPEPIQKKHKV